MQSLQQDIVSNLIKVDITHSVLSMRIPEARFSKLDTVIDVKVG